MNFFQFLTRWMKWLKIILVAAATALVAVWLFYTPEGLLGKMDAIGYAVCHQISARSFFVGDEQFPLCARCSGMYLGAFAGLVYLFFSGRRGGLPPVKIMVVLGVFLCAFGIDGVNSYMQFFPNFPALYTPHNNLRLFTGTALGTGMAALVLPVFHQTVWMEWDQRSSLAGWKELGGMVLVAGLVALAVLSDIPVLLYPLAIISSLTVLVILTLVYSVLAAILFKRENSFRTWYGLRYLLLFGFTLALLQITVLDGGRFWLTGTWAGFALR